MNKHRDVFSILALENLGIAFKSGNTKAFSQSLPFKHQQIFGKFPYSKLMSDLDALQRSCISPLSNSSAAEVGGSFQEIDAG